MRWIVSGSRTRRLTWRSPLVWALGATLTLAACQPAPAASPTAAPTKPAAPAAPAGSPSAAASPAAPSGSPAAKPAASPAAAAAAAPAPQPIVDPEAERFFSGKTITFSIGYAPGGGSDLQARLLAAILPRYIPGSPQVVVTNVPGADSLVNAQQTMRKTPNGLEWGHFSSGMILQAVTGKKFEGFDPMEPIYLGMVDGGGNPSHLCARTDVVPDLDSFMKSTRKFRLAETSPASNPAPVMEWMKMVGMPVETVYGYGGTSELRAAFDRKETELSNRCNTSDIQVFPQWFETDFARPLMYWGKEPPEVGKKLMAEGKIPWYKNLMDVATNATPNQKAGLETYLGLNGVHVHILPPKTPENTVRVLKAAYSAALRDPELKTGLEQRGQEYNPLDGDDIRKRVDTFAASNKEVVEVVGNMVQGGN
jgi:tripartite-type tricarboxylate transporter receptor subunit TctC